MLERGAGGGVQKRPEGCSGIQSRKNWTVRLLFCHTLESVIHLANIYCVPTVSEAVCQGLATEAKGTVLVLRKSGLGGGNTPGQKRLKGLEPELRHLPTLGWGARNR